MILWATPRRVGFFLSCASHAKALAALGQGRFEDAYQHASAISRAEELAPYVPTALFVIMDLVEAAVRTRRRAQAATVGRRTRPASLRSRPDSA
ncbi:hypothetical protein [Streptomyces sp. NPDC055287]